jgi:hypothetical protein
MQVVKLVVSVSGIADIPPKGGAAHHLISTPNKLPKSGSGLHATAVLKYSSPTP